LASSLENDFRLLVDDLPMNTAPFWSPDGGRIAYADGLAWNVMDTDGVGRTIVSGDNPTGIFCLAWSPDGAELFCLVQTEGTLRRLTAYRIDDTGGMRVLADDAPFFIRDISNAQWSPDGTLLALREFEEHKLYVYSPQRDALQNTGIQTEDDFTWFSNP